MNIHYNLEAIKMIACEYAKKHNCNYNIIIHNPDEFGNFTQGSTYEFVVDSYFEKERPNVKLLFKTDDLFKENLTEPSKQMKAPYVPTDDQQPYIIKNVEQPKPFFRTTNTKPSTNNRHHRGKK